MEEVFVCQLILNQILESLRRRYLIFTPLQLRFFLNRLLGIACKLGERHDLSEIVEIDN